MKKAIGTTRQSASKQAISDVSPPRLSEENQTAEEEATRRHGDTETRRKGEKVKGQKSESLRSRPDFRLSTSDLRLTPDPRSLTPDCPVPSYKIEGAGPLLVYIAGLDGTGEMLFKQMPELSRSYRVVTFRLRDHGRFTYEDLADDVAAIISDMREQRATILTESFGGGVALTFALRYSYMLERLALVNSFPRYRRRIRIHLAARLASIIPFRLVWYGRKAADTIGLLLDDVKGEDRRRFFEIIRTVEREGYARRLQLISELDLDDRLSEIEAPVLIIAVEKDLLVRSVYEARRMAERMPRATVKIIKNAGHACLLGNRVRLAEMLDEWSATAMG